MAAKYNMQYQLSDNAAELYERYSGRIMVPWIDSLIELSDLQPGERVLDLACGTGKVARLAAVGVGSSGSVVGLDLNAAMLATARDVPPSDSGAAIEWREGDATHLPFEDATFDIVLCSQGLQYFPDRTAALREIRRVLVTGGRLVLSVWGPLQDNPFQSAVYGALGSHLGIEGVGGFVLGDAQEVHSLIADEGFRDVSVRSIERTLSLPAAQEMVTGFLRAHPTAETIAALPEADRTALFDDIIQALSPYVSGEELVVPGKVNFAMGRG